MANEKAHGSRLKEVKRKIENDWRTIIKKQQKNNKGCHGQ